jgi:hypothetical protein
MLEQDSQRLAGLAAWRPEHGVLSLYLDIDPADRGGGWRVALREQLEEIGASVHRNGDHGRRRAIEATAERVLERFPADSPHPSGRTQVGFVEVSEHEAREHWHGLQLEPPGTVAEHRQGPVLAPFVELLDHGARRAVVAASAELVRAWRWEGGRMERQDEWEAVFTSPQWRERKGPSMPDPARGETTSSSGRDQFDQRIEANRERFLHQAGKRIAQQLNPARWREAILFGDPPYAGELLHGLGRPLPVHTAEGDLIEHGDDDLAARVRDLVDTLREEAAGDQLERARDAALSSQGRGALGFRSTAKALAEGRVDRLLFVPDAEAPIDDSIPGGVAEDLDPLEWAIHSALHTSADLIPLTGDAAEQLSDEHGGVAAILRY